MANGKEHSMNGKFFGAILVILGCGGFGFSMAAAHRREEIHLQQLMDIVQYLHCELEYHLTPLPELCRKAAQQGRGGIYAVFEELARILESQTLPQATDGLHLAMKKADLSPGIREMLTALGRMLGQFDLKGQLMELENLRLRCGQALENLRQSRDDRLRSYQTLGLCAGTALVILFI